MYFTQETDYIQFWKLKFSPKVFDGMKQLSDCVHDCV